jgi:hypothetical protein
MTYLKTSLDPILSFVLAGFFILSGLSLASDACANDVSVVVVSRQQATDICINVQDQCRALQDGEFFSVDDSVTIKHGTATLFSIQTKEVFDLVSGTYRVAELLSERQTDEDGNKLKTLMSVNNRVTSSFSTRHSDKPICTSSPIKERWLNNCKLKSVLPDDTEQISLRLQLPEHAFYTHFPATAIDAVLKDELSTNVVIVTSQGICNDLKNQSIEDLMALFEKSQAISFLTPGKYKWIQHDVLAFPDKCQTVFERELKEIESSSGPDRTLKKYKLYERFSLKYQALEALKQPINHKPPVY